MLQSDCQVENLTALLQLVIPQPSCLDTSVPKSSKPVILLRRVATIESFQLSNVTNTIYQEGYITERLVGNLSTGQSKEGLRNKSHGRCLVALSAQQQLSKTEQESKAQRCLVLRNHGAQQSNGARCIKTRISYIYNQARFLLGVRMFNLCYNPTIRQRTNSLVIISYPITQLS